MFKKVFSIAIVLLVISGCVGTMRVANDTPSKNSKGVTMQTKVDNNTTKK